MGMEQSPNVVIVMARCTHNKESFGIRFEEHEPGQWIADWAFPIQERSAKKEGYDQNEINGTITLTNEYPACPYCEARGIVHCGTCDKVACWDTHSTQVICPWCAQTGQISGQITKLKAGGDL